MRRAGKVKITPQVVLRKAAASASSASRRPFPAWVSSDEAGLVLPATSVRPRVRTALVLRLVKPARAAKPKGASDGRGAR